MTTDVAAPTDAPRRPRRRAGKITLIVVIAVVAVVSLITSLTPWPSALLIRAVFEAGAASTVAEMDRHAPTATLQERSGVSFGDAATTFDVITPATGAERLPTVVWVHGGAWISGESAHVTPYLRLLAAAGYTTIALNYALGPEATYPTAVEQLNAALADIDTHAAELNVDASRIVLAGDSAGAQLASQLATIITNPRYAGLVGIDAALRPSQLVGTILHCGVYDLRAMAELQGIVAWGFKIALWAYTGNKNWSELPSGALMSTLDFVDADFPPTFISGGNGDPLTWLQSIPMASRLSDLDVPTTELFWAASHEPALPHEYQFHLDLPEAQTALDQTLDWLDDVTAQR